MSYFQKYQKLCNHSRTTNHTSDSFSNEHNSTAEFKQKTHSRESYLKAFKKYYLDQFVNQPEHNFSQQNKENFFFHEPNKDKPHSTFTHTKSVKQTENFKKMAGNERKASPHLTPQLTPQLTPHLSPNISRSKVAEMVNCKENQLEALIYNSISEMEREVMSFGSEGELAKENKMLRACIEKMKLILKQKLKEALTKNKEELTLMFDEYSAMIKKLLEDKEKLTTQLEGCKSKLSAEEELKKNMEQAYEARIKLIVEQNNGQIANTKQQIEEFLDMIIQYEEEANAEKTEFEKMREKIVQLEMENDKLKKEIDSCRSQGHSSGRVDFHAFERDQCTQKNSEFASKSEFASESKSKCEDSFQNSGDGQTTNKYVTNRSSDDDDDDLTEIERYAQKIENLLDMLDKLQEENKELNEFLKSCKCSRIKCRKMESTETDSHSLEDLKRAFQNQLIQAEKDYIKEEMCLREAIRKKDQCIDRLTLVIEEIRKARYESVDRITRDALKKT